MAKLLKIIDNFSISGIRYTYDITVFIFSFLLIFNYKNFLEYDVSNSFMNSSIIFIFLISILLQNYLTSKYFLSSSFMNDELKLSLFLILINISFGDISLPL